MLTENKNENKINSDNIVTTTNPLRREQTNNNNNDNDTDDDDDTVDVDDIKLALGGGIGQRPYQMPYVSSYDKNNSSFENNNTKSNISYYITIDMALQKGTSLTPEILSNLKCLNKWGAVRKSYADLRGLKYLTLPDYNNNLPSKNIENSKTKPKTQKGGLGLITNKTKNKTRKRK
jgi:hypothetical protein